MEVEPYPLLPSLGGLDPRALKEPGSLKRKSSVNSEQSQEKRQFVGNAYEEIAKLAIQAFEDDIYVCDGKKPSSFTYDFIGRGRDFKVGPVSLIFRAQLTPTSYNKSHNDRVFLLTFRMKDSKGPFDVWPFMESDSVPILYRIKCGTNLYDIRAEIYNTIYMWLDFATKYYILSSPGPVGR